MNNIKKSLKNSNGITLIALVITIIVLLILAGISISMLSGDNGVLQRATDAKTQTGIGQEKETIALAYNSALAKKVSNGNSSTVTDSELNEELNNSEATASGNPIIVTFTKSGNTYEIDSNGIIKPSTPKNPNTTLKVSENKGKTFDTNKELVDDYENKITLPKGFKIIETSPNVVTGGIIIEDATYTNTIGSQFVWIPVGDVYTDINGSKINIALGRYNFFPTSVPSEYGVLTVSSVKELISNMPDQAMVDEMLVDGAYYELSALVGKEDSEIQSWIDAGGSVEQATESMMNSSANTEETTFRVGSKDDNINATAKELSAFISSANSKGGFYIGRYEARTTTQRKNSTSNDLTITDSNLTQITEKQSDYVYNFVTQLQAAKLSREMYSKDNENNNITEFASDLVNSYAWDTATLFLQECGEEGYSIKNSMNTEEDGLAEKGTSIDHPCNIYDMASNCFEWTTETHCEGPCSSRGGCYLYQDFSDNYYTSSRNSFGNTNASDLDRSFRPVLYVK